MDREIPKQLKAYIKKVGKKREKKLVHPSYKQKQANKQSQVVIINQEPRRTRAPNKPRPSAPSGGGGNAPYPNVAYIPYTLPQPSLPQMSAANYGNTALQPVNEIQQLTQALNQFQATPVYRNPLRMAPFRNAMNPAPMQQVEEPLPEPIQAPPPPEMPDIVEEQNFVEQLARPPIAVPIDPSMPVYQGFAQNQAVNDLARQQDMEVNAYEDFGGYDAQSPREPAIPQEARDIQRDQDLILSLRRDSRETATRHFTNMARIEQIPEADRTTADRVLIRDANGYLYHRRDNPAILAVLQRARLEYMNSGKGGKL
jgi:hypothetical protein